MPDGLSKAEQEQVKEIIKSAQKDDGTPRTAQQTLPFERVFPDGIVRVGMDYYTKTILFQDINYQLAQQEDKTEIFEEWCSFLNFFDSSVHFQLSFMNFATEIGDFEKKIAIAHQADPFNDVRDEYSGILLRNMQAGNNGLTKTKYITFGIHADSMKSAKPRLIHIEMDILNNFKRLGVIAETLTGEQRLALMHKQLHMGLLGSCSALGGGGGDVLMGTSYTATDRDILGAEDDYKDLEKGLQDDIDEIDTDGYDEVNYYLDEIGHNPYQLAAILTVIDEAYKRNQVQDILQKIFDLQYELTTEEVEETKEKEVTKTGTRWVEDEDHEDGGYWETYTYTETEEYQYYILNVYLVNNTLDGVLDGLGFTEKEKHRAALLLYTYGNRKYLFGDDDIYNIPGEGEGDSPDHHVPGEYLSDEEFARMLAEAEKYLGTSYVWGGYSPSGFDCSGFVSWVINHCGNGWNYGRQTANGLRGITSYVSTSEAKPGDLIFFQGTYDTPGASHVGIYVGGGWMIHAGNPVHYSSINTPYWQEHFLEYGRLP